MGREPRDEATWDWYVAPGGGDVVGKELRSASLTKQEIGRLERARERIRTRQTRRGDVKAVGKGVLEARVDGDTRIFRLFYAEVDGGLVFLALRFTVKKSRRVPQDIATAQDRLADWRQRFQQR